MAGGARIVAIDAARGAAMVLVFISHVKQHFVLAAPDLHFFLTAATRVATPTFLLLSGFIAAHLLRSDTRGSVALTLADRALFLLVVAHALLGLEDLSEYGVAHWLFGRVAMTDAIAVAFLAALLLRHAGAGTLARTGIFLGLGSWLIATTVTFPWEWARAAARVLFDSPALGSSAAGQSLALVPYVGVFFIGMALSLRLRSALVAQDNLRLSRQLALVGAGAIGLVIAGVLAWMATRHLLADAVPDTPLAQLIRRTLDPRAKQPPSPAYFLFYGGAGLLMLAVFVRGWPARLIVPIRRHAAVIGRASLFCFIVQDWLFKGVPKALGFDGSTSVAFWCAYLAANGVLLYALAAWWDANGNNRFITVGLKPWLRRRAGRRRATLGPRTV